MIWFINTPISCITITDIDDVEGSNSYSLRDIAKWSTLPYENIPPSGLLGDENSNNTYVSRDTEASCHLVAPFIWNKHIHPFGIINPQKSLLYEFCDQLLFSILRTISHSFHVNALKFRLVQYDNFYGGEKQEDASECLMMLRELINKGSVPYSGFNDNNSTGVSISEILFSFMLEKHILSAMHVDWDPPHLSLVACYILHLLVPRPCRNW